MIVNRSITSIHSVPRNVFGTPRSDFKEPELTGTTMQAMPHPRTPALQLDTSAIDKIAVFLSEHYTRDQFTKMLGDGSYLHLRAVAGRLYLEHKGRQRVQTAFGKMLAKSENCHVNIFCLALCEIKKWRTHSTAVASSQSLAG